MMLPSLVPMLILYRNALLRLENVNLARLGWLTTLVGAGYFAVWTVIGMVIYPVGIALSTAEMECSSLSRAVPLGVGLLVLIVGALQLTSWKARRLVCCRTDDHPSDHPSLEPDRVYPVKASAAWRHGLHVGVRCAQCCFGLMLILIVMGVMDLRLMAIVTTGITAERLAPNGVQVARAIGWLAVAIGVVLIARPIGVS
jgi:predicted metal-binding membrane protein